MASFVVEEVEGIEIAHRVKYHTWRSRNRKIAGEKYQASLGCRGNTRIYRSGKGYTWILAERFLHLDYVPRFPKNTAPWDAPRATQEERILYILGNGKNLPEVSDRVLAASPCLKCFPEKGHVVKCPTCGHQRKEVKPSEGIT